VISYIAKYIVGLQRVKLNVRSVKEKNAVICKASMSL